jgi:CBS domain-containing protein
MKRWYVGDVMTRDVVTVSPATGYKEIADLLVHWSISAVPVVDRDDHVLGVVSEADLLAKLEYADRVPRHALAARRMRDGRRKAHGDVAAELMTAPAVAIAATATVTRAARLLDAARVKRMPVVDDDDRLVGILSRRDLVRIYTRPDREIGAAVDGVLRSLWIDPGQVHIAVRAGIVTLSGHVDRRRVADVAVAFSRATPGVVDVLDELTCDVDDRVPDLSRQ